MERVRTKWIVVLALVRAGFPWGVFISALSCPIYLNVSLETSLRVMPVAFVAGWALATGAGFLLPMERYGEWVVAKVRAGGDSVRLRNVAEGLAIAIGESVERVAVIEVATPNVGAFPARRGSVVVATEGAVDAMERSELNALVASQLIIASDRWVRLASGAQLVQSPRFALLFASCFIHPVFFPCAFLAFFGNRYADAARDLAADEVAVRTTYDPPALARALRALSRHADDASGLRIGLPAFLGDQFWVLSMRSKTKTTVSGVGRERSWTTADEVRAELELRAERLEAAASGDWSGFQGLRAWKRKVRALGSAGV